MSSEVPPKARIKSLYVLKALCSFLVVVVHTQFCAKGALTPLLGIATPCFLTITGFLLYSADAQREQYKALKWARKTFLLSLACNALYLAFYLWDGAPLSRYGVEMLGLNLLTGHKISMHLWYLTAVWQGLLLLWLLRRYAPWLIRLAPLLYIIAYVLRAYGKQLFPGLDADTLFIMRANAIVTALPFLATGYLVHQYQERLLKHINVIACTIGMVLLAYAEYALRQWLGGSSIYFLSTWPMVVMLMLLCCRYKPFTLPVVGYIGRAHSANIYYFHILVLIYANRLVPEYAAWQAVLVFAGTLPISCLFNTIINGYRKAANRIKACQEARAGV